VQRLSQGYDKPGTLDPADKSANNRPIFRLLNELRNFTNTSTVILPHRCPGRERIPPGGFMDILAALRQEEAKFEKQVNAAQQQLDNVRAAIKLLGGMNVTGKATANNSAKTTADSSGKATGQKKRVMSAAARAKMAKAQKERWAKFRAAKAKGK
jgi:hypothetical protein